MWNRIKQYFNVEGWLTRGTGESIWDAAEWAAPDGKRGERRPPFWYVIYIYFKEKLK